MILPRSVAPEEPGNLLIDQVRQQYAKFVSLERRTLAVGIELGRLLLRAKAQVDHGGWLPWLASTGVPERTAQRLMFLAGKSDSLSDLPADLPVSRAIAVLQQIDELPANVRRYVADQAARELSTRRLKELASKRRSVRPPLAMVTPPSPSCSMPEHIAVQIADAATLAWDDGAVDLWVTSPPYCLGLAEAGYIDYDDYPRYLRLARLWASEMHRVAAPWGRLCLNVPLDISRPREPLAADWVQVLRSVGWTYRTVILWQEGNISRGTARGSVDSPGAPNVICPTEVVLVFHKGSWNLAPARRQRPEWAPPDLTRQEWLDWTLANWSFAGEKAERVGGYPAAFPEELARRCIKLFSFPRAVVGDPFCGSGTTPLVAARLGRRCLASDISPAAVQLAQARVAAAA